MTIDARTAGPAERLFPAWGGPSERLRFLLQWAVLAPSRHNSQPWVFEIEGDELRVYADLSRALPVADPDGRQLVMACGAAAVNVRLAAAHFCLATSTEIVPAHRRDGLLARIRIEERRATTPDAEEMFQAIPRRRTNRLPLDGRQPPDFLVTALTREARREGAWLRPIGEQERCAVSELVAEGDRLQWGSPRFRAELAQWTRPNGTARKDGMPGYALGMSDAAALLHPLLVRLSGRGDDEAERDRHRARACKALLVLSTPRDGRAEWFAAGEALQRVLLRATARGLSASYFAQPIETPDLRTRLQDLLAEPGVPQVMFRLGYGREVRPVPRRAPDDVLRREVAERPNGAMLALRTPPPAGWPAGPEARPPAP